MRWRLSSVVAVLLCLVACGDPSLSGYGMTCVDVQDLQRHFDTYLAWLEAPDQDRDRLFSRRSVLQVRKSYRNLSDFDLAQLDEACGTSLLET